MSSKRDRLVNGLKAVTAADMVSYGFSGEESACVVKLLAAMSRASGAIVVNGERFSDRVVAEVKADRKIVAIKQHREDTRLGLADAKEAVERLQRHLGIPDPYAHANLSHQVGP